MDANQTRNDSAYVYSRKLRAKNYELTNHLGNVLATVSDKKVHPQETADTNGVFDPTIGYQADVTSRYDYYPFGMEIKSRSGDFLSIDYSKVITELEYKGLLSACSDYTTINDANTTNTVVCTTATDAFGRGLCEFGED